MKVINSISIVIGLVFLSGCSVLGPDRTFVSELEENEDILVPRVDYPVVVGDEQVDRSMSDIWSRTPKYPSDKFDSSKDKALESELVHLESKLTDDQYDAYQRYKYDLGSLSERIYFLRLPSLREKEEYLRTKGIYQGLSDSYNSSLSPLADEDEIYLGMSKNSVIKAWGRPAKIDVAGNPAYQNERWSFFNYGRSKYVYFENGRVKGWLVE